jgi:hypothetical protein
MALHRLDTSRVAGIVIGADRRLLLSSSFRGEHDRGAIRARVALLAIVSGLAGGKILDDQMDVIRSFPLLPEDNFGWKSSTSGLGSQLARLSYKI